MNDQQKERIRTLLLALAALTTPDGTFACIPEGPERDALEEAYYDAIVEFGI